MTTLLYGLILDLIVEFIRNPSKGLQRLISYGILVGWFWILGNFVQFALKLIGG